MAFETNIPGHILISEESDIVFGTCMLGEAFGEIKKCDLDRTADQETIDKCTGGLRALLLLNPRFELKLETVFDSGVTPPALGDEITFPLADVKGRVLKSSVAWEMKGSRGLSIEATHWDSMATDDGSGTMENKAFNVAADGTPTEI